MSEVWDRGESHRLKVSIKKHREQQNSNINNNNELRPFRQERASHNVVVVAYCSTDISRPRQSGSRSTNSNETRLVPPCRPRHGEVGSPPPGGACHKIIFVTLFANSLFFAPPIFVFVLFLFLYIFHFLFLRFEKSCFFHFSCSL